MVHSGRATTLGPGEMLFINIYLSEENKQEIHVKKMEFDSPLQTHSL